MRGRGGYKNQKSGERSRQHHAEGGDSGEKWRNLRNDYTVLSARFRSELGDKGTEKEGSRMMPRSLV